MIHPQALGFSIPKPSEDQLVSFPEDLLKFYPDRRQAVDIEESSVVDFVRRYPPESRAVGLFLEEGIQEIKAARVSRPTVKNLDRLFKSIPDLRAFPVKGRYALFDDLFFPVALSPVFRGLFPFAPANIPGLSGCFAVLENAGVLFPESRSSP